MVLLVPMTALEFDRYLAPAIASYAEAHIKAGDCEPGDALALAQAEYASLLPQGLASPGQHLLSIRVDANAGWTAKEAIRIIHALAPYNIEFVEQPVAAHDLAGLKLIRERVPLPIIADESCVTVEDIPRIAECVDGISIKLMK